MKPQSRRARRPSREEAEALAVSALAFVAAEPERLGRFLSLSGLGPETVRQAARDPAFLPAVLDYLMAHEPDLLAFAAELKLDPAAVAAARTVLGGERQR
jgi:hypothetical protein